MWVKASALTQEVSTSKQVLIRICLAAGMKDMHLDKCGAVSTFTAFQYAVAEKLPINLTVSLGFV